VRRLIIVAARGLVVALPAPRAPKPKPMSIFVRDGVGTGIVRIGSRQAVVRAAPRARSLPLLDPLKRWGRRPRPKQRSMPRITFDFDRPRIPAPPPPSPDDPLDAARLHRRIEALASALDDLPRQAQRLARWRARRDAAVAENSIDVGRAAAGGQNQDDAQGKGRAPGKDRFRLSPMRPGRPPGWHRRPGHKVDELLNELHGLAFWALQRPDTS
jgi:hypothetical protein